MHDFNPASAMARLRWDRLDPEERRKQMRLIRRKGLLGKKLKEELPKSEETD